MAHHTASFFWPRESEKGRIREISPNQRITSIGDLMHALGCLTAVGILITHKTASIFSKYVNSFLDHTFPSDIWHSVIVVNLETKNIPIFMRPQASDQLASHFKIKRPASSTLAAPKNSFRRIPNVYSAHHSWIPYMWVKFRYATKMIKTKKWVSDWRLNQSVSNALERAN